MMSGYNYRSYLPGDEEAINSLYFDITGIKRSTEDYFWEWFKAPGGPGDIWLILAKAEDGREEIIGHHGIIPFRFSRLGEDLLFGKTENTMVRPEYRGKILFPRFERRFRERYEHRFDGLFSTVGPKGALRQRQAQGYQMKHAWIDLRWRLRPLANPLFIFSSAMKKTGAFREGSLFSRLQSRTTMASRYLPVSVRCYSGEDAKQVTVFSDLWDAARGKYCVTSSRGYEDLYWRYWSNPHREYMGLLLDSETAGGGMAIVSNPRWGVLFIEDFFVEYPRSKSFKYLLNGLLAWAAKCGVFSVRFIISEDSIDWIGRDNFFPDFKPMGIWSFITKNHLVPQTNMPRKLCARGLKRSVTADKWFITASVF